MKSKGWRVVRWGLRDIEMLVEVFPRGDTRRHSRGVHAPRCWCQPKIETTNAGRPLVAHHAADGRELFEEHGVS